MRLNKFVANSGICTRREADVLIAQGVVSVNGVVTTKMGSQINPVEDHVQVHGKDVAPQKRVYCLYNKPAGEECLGENGVAEKTWPELARRLHLPTDCLFNGLQTNNCGLLLLTNDLALKEQLSAEGPDQLFHVSIDSPLAPDSLEKLTEGVDTSQGVFAAKEAEEVTGKESGLGIRFSGGSDVQLAEALAAVGIAYSKIDRVMIEGLTKWDLPRGRSRLLQNKEIGFLKMKK